MKLTFVTVLAIGLLPQQAIASSIDNPTWGWTQPSLLTIADQQSNSSGNGTPTGKRRPAVTRGGSCKQADKQTDKPLTALVPENANGLTTVEDPAFWFYIPDVPDDVESIKFSLHSLDVSGKDTATLYRTSLQLTKTPGVIGVPLPPKPNYSLKLNERYHWRFIVTCNQKKPSEEPVVLLVEGWVTRVQQSSNPWYDELTNLAKRYLLEPQNPEVKKAWTEKLKSVGLEDLAQAPLVSSVSHPENDLRVQFVNRSR